VRYKQQLRKLFSGMCLIKGYGYSENNKKIRFKREHAHQMTRMRVLNINHKFILFLSVLFILHGSYHGYDMAYGQGLTHSTKPVFKSQMHINGGKQVLRSYTFNELRTQEHRAASRKKDPMGLFRVATEIECKKGIAKNATTNHVGCAQPKGALKENLPKTNRISRESINGGDTEPVNKSSTVLLTKENNKGVGRYHEGGVFEGDQAIERNANGNQKYLDGINQVGFNYEGQAKKPQNMIQHDMSSQILGGGRAQLPDFEDDTPAKVKKQLKRYNNMVEKYFKKNKTFLGKTKNTSRLKNKLK
jgi:hypothetical protein